MPLAGWLDDGLLESVAAEDNLSETAFFVLAGRALLPLGAEAAVPTLSYARSVD